MESENNNLDIAQTVSGLIEGDQLLLQFDYANRSNPGVSGAFEVLWNGEVIFSNEERNTNFRTASLVVNAIEDSNILQIRGSGAIDTDGSSIDNISLRSLPSDFETRQNILDGGTGNDILTGAFTNDTIIGGTGDDILRGAGGDDVYIFNRGDGQDVIDDREGLNAIQFGSDIAPDQVRLVRGERNIILEIIGTGDRIDLGWDADRNMALNEVRFADGTIWDADALVDQALAPTLGNDRIFGTANDEILVGDAGDDNLIGEAGNDDIAGGTGVDLLEGGAGDDVYRFALGDGQDRIVDASGDADTLIFGAGITASDIRVSQSSDGNAFILTIGDEDRVRIDNALAGGKIESIICLLYTSPSPRDRG